MRLVIHIIASLKKIILRYSETPDMKHKTSRQQSYQFPVRKIAASAVGAVAIVTATILLSFGKGKALEVPAYTVLRVIDGDTFETTENQLIRLAGIDAPELQLCGSKEAAKILGKLIIEKPLYMKILRRDPYMRLDSQVYANKTYVNKAMLESGWARLKVREDFDATELKMAAAIAKEKKIGLFSEQCTQTENPQNKNCAIKGNNPENGGGEKTYHLPACKEYKTTQVQLYIGDEWFCTEKEAQQAGYRKSKDCP